MRLLLTTLSLLCLLETSYGIEKPQEFAKRFYQAYKAWGIRGVPTIENEGIVSQFVGIEIIRAFRRVDVHRDLEAERYDPKNPMKPRWSLEGDVFCNNWEGITNFKIGKSKIENGVWIVEANLEYIEDGKSYPWTDVLVLDRHGANWVIADIRYSGGETLLTSLYAELKEADQEILKSASKKQKLENKSQ